MVQKYRIGDKVQLKSTFPRNMSHFFGIGKQAIIIGSYKQLYGGGRNEERIYSLLILGDGKPYSSSWYGDANIKELVSPRCMAHLDLLEEYLSRNR